MDYLNKEHIKAQIQSLREEIQKLEKSIEPFSLEDQNSSDKVSFELQENRMVKITAEGMSDYVDIYITQDQLNALINELKSYV
jgi:DNA-binding protein YbaB